MPPVIDRTCCKAVTREIRGRVQAPDAVMANKDNFPVFRRFGDDFLHQLLSEKCGALDVNGIPFLPAANIDQWELFARLQPLRDLCRAKSAFFDLLRARPGSYRSPPPPEDCRSAHKPRPKFRSG